MTKSHRSLKLASEYRDCIAALNSRAVTYVLVGAYAVGWRGAARATGDIDFLYQQTHDNVARLCAALRDFGATSSLIDPEFMMSRAPGIFRGPHGQPLRQTPRRIRWEFMR